MAKKDRNDHASASDTEAAASAPAETSAEKVDVAPPADVPAPAPAPELTEAQKKIAESKRLAEVQAAASASIAVDGVTDANTLADLVTENAVAADVEGPTPLKKINPKDVMEGDIKGLIMSGKLKLPADLFLLYGAAVNLRDGESSFGPWTALVGEFRAIRIHDDREFIAMECHIPGAAGDMLVSGVRKFVIEDIPVTADEFKKHGKTYKVTGETVEMALVVSAVPSARAGGAPYEFKVRPLVKIATVNTLAHLETKAQKFLALRKQALLAAPKTADVAPVS